MSQCVNSFVLNFLLHKWWLKLCGFNQLKCGVHKLWKTGEEGIILGLMRLHMRFIGWWTWCNLMQRNPELESHLLVPWLWKISWGANQLSSLVGPLRTRQMHGWGSVRRYVERLGALMYKSWPSSHSFL